MRRFLDWTAVQSAGQLSAPDTSSSASNSSSSNPKNKQGLQCTQSQYSASSNLSTQLQHQQHTSNPTRDLEIQHLARLLHEIKYHQASSSPLPSASSSQNQREFVEKIHKTLPLFLNVFGTPAATFTAHPFTPTKSSSQSSVDQGDGLISESGSTSSKPNSPLPPKWPHMERFPDLLPFAFTVARLFVSEVRQRASNKHAEDASLAILKFLTKKNGPTQPASEPNTNNAVSQESSSNPQNEMESPATNRIETQGWNLLSTLNILALSQSTQIMQLLCDASLPSTLIKCLYLFFDFPEVKKDQQQDNPDQPDTTQEESISFARKVTTGPLIRAFNQLLVQLCSYQSAIDELIKKDDLRLLIGMASSQCSVHNKPWRKIAFQSLLAISRNMRDNFVYLEQNLCIQIYVENVHRINSLGLITTGEFIDMIKNLIEFLYHLDVNNRNQPKCISPLIEQFKSSRLVDLIDELIGKIDESVTQEAILSSPLPSIDSDQFNLGLPSLSSEATLLIDEHRRNGRRLIQSLSTLAKINTCQESMTELVTLKPLAMSRFEMLDQFKLIKPSAKNCILNIEALQLMKMIWSKCRDGYLIESILDAAISLFNDDKYNYFIFESQQLLVYYMTSSNFNQLSFRVKQKLFKFLEFIIIETNYIPCLELGTLGTIIKRKSCTDTDLILTLRTLVACLRYNSKFSDIFRDIGLLEVIIDTLIDCMQQDNRMNFTTEKIEVLYLLLETSQYLVAGPNNQNCTQFNESGAARHVFNCISKPEFFHLFVPAHNSSSDDSGNPLGAASCTSTPSMTTFANKPYAYNHDRDYLDVQQTKPSVKQLQKVAFTIIRQLILSSAGDEHLANLLGLLARNLDDLKSYGESLEALSRLSKVDDDSSSRATPIVRGSSIDFQFLLSQEVSLKTCILKSLMIVLKESHRCRRLFRKAGGFIYIVSALTTLADSLPSPCEQTVANDGGESGIRWRKVNSRRIWRLIKNSLTTIVVAMRMEPANQRVFLDEVIDKFTEAIRHLGCFTDSRKLLSKVVNSTDKSSNSPLIIANDTRSVYSSIFLAPPTRDFSTIVSENAKPNEACCQLLRFLYDMSLDMGDGTSDLELYLERDKHLRQPLASNDLARAQSSKSISFDYDSSSDVSREYGVFKKRSLLHKAPLRPPSLDLNFKTQAAANLTFPATILTIIDLIPSCPSEDLMLFACSTIKSLLQHERNQQMLCEAGLISKLLCPNWNIAITDKNHFLHEPTKFILEKLSRQSISARELRTYLRLGNPLMCSNLVEIEIDESKTEGCKTSTTKQVLCGEQEFQKIESKSREKIATDRIDTLASMMTCGKSIAQPPFAEFDMSGAGFSTIFLPSIAPINCRTLPPHASTFLNSTLDVHTNEKDGILGGVGTVERSFPPPNGLSYSTWICIDKFPARSSDLTHNIRLLTIYRGSASTGKEYSCFKLQISALDRAVTISTQETLLFDNENRSDTNLDPECNVRIWTPELLVEGKWHHLVVTMTRSSSKQTSINVYVDGSLVHNQRVCYISSSVGALNLVVPLGCSGSNNVNATSAAAYVNAFIGPLPQTRIHLRTRWKQGPCHLIEDAWSSHFVQTIYCLGPHYIGNFQSSLKLSELAKLKSIGHEQARSHHPHETAPSRNRHNLTHQQSSSIATQTARAHNSSKSGHHHLTRVASSQVSSSSSSANSSQQSTGVVTRSSSVTEDKIIMSLDARSISFLTLARMRKIYTRFDCRQVSRVLGLAMHENAAPILLLHNTGVHLSGPSRGIGAVTLGYNHVRCFVPSPAEITLYNIGGCHILLGMVAQTETVESFNTSLRCLAHALNQNSNLQSQMETINGYQTLAVFLWKKKHLLNAQTLKLIFSLIAGNRSEDVVLMAAVSTITTSHMRSSHPESYSARRILQVGALRELICECFDLWNQTGLIDMILEFLYELINSNASQDSLLGSGPSAASTRAKNLKCVRDMDLLPQMFRLLSRCESQHQQNQSDIKIIEIGIKNLLEKSDITASHQPLENSHEFNSKAIYLIKQTVFELLNRTPRQSDILYFGQYLASLMPTASEQQQDMLNCDRPRQTVNLRNILLRSLLQMMTKNDQKEVNNAMQEELVRILGFDWFMLFISGDQLDRETITIGFMNLMIILSNDELYESFKSNSTPNGGWLKEPAFTSTDDKFSIQLLGISNGMFAGLGGRRNSIKQEALKTPNFLLLISCLTNLIKLPRIYLMMFQTMLGQFTKMEPRVLDAIESFEELNLDSLCDCLVGDTHHKRRKTLAESQFRCYELTVCLVHMIAEITSQHESSLTEIEETKIEPSVMLDPEMKKTNQSHESYPIELIRFLLYLYNNNKEFQDFCSHSYDLVDALAETLMLRRSSDDNSIAATELDADSIPPTPSRSPLNQKQFASRQRRMTQHLSTKAILELSRLIILDSMTQTDDHLDQLHLFDRFIASLSICREAQGELVDMLLQQILLMIDSTARHNSIKTIGGSENVLHFQRLLVNSIQISQIVTDKIWLGELYADCSLSKISAIIDHQLCLTEQVFLFNELLPKHSPPHAFVMQRVINRIVLYAISRPVQHISDKMLMLDLLKKIYDNRAIIIFNHMHSPQSAEFFVCFTYCLMTIIEANSSSTQNVVSAQYSIATDEPSSLIERQYGHPAALSKHPSMDPTNTGLSAIMLVSMARKIWDAIYQSKKGVLSEAFDVSLSLPAFTLETSLDLLQLKPNINDCCQRYWSQYFESEQRPKKRVQQRQSASGADAQSAVPTSSGSQVGSSVPACSTDRGHHLLSGRLTSVVNAASFVSRVVSATAGTMASNVGERLSQSSSRAVSGKLSNETQSASSGIGGSTMIGLSGRHAAVSRMDYMCGERDGASIRRQLEKATQAHVAMIADFIKEQLSQRNHKLALHKYLCEEWLDTEREILLRERAIFGPDHGSQLDKWCLDITEGPKRMRKKLAMSTKQFYENYTSDPQQQQLNASGSGKSLKYRPPMSYDSYTYYLKTRNLDNHLLDLKELSSESSEKQPVKETRPSEQSSDSRSSTAIGNIAYIPEADSNDSRRANTTTPLATPIGCTINIDRSSPVNSIGSRELNLSFESVPSPLGSRLFADRESPKPTPSEGDPSDGDSTSFVDFSPEIEAETNSARESENSTDSLSVLRLLEKNERISHMFRCSRVQGLDTYEGLLLFGREHFYHVDGFTLLKTREIKDIDSLPADAHDPIIPNSTPNVSSAHSKKVCAKFSFNSVVEVHKRRYLLQPIALEVFSSDGRNTLVVFPRNIRNKVYSRLLTVATQMTSNAHESLAGQKSNVSVEAGSGLLSNLIGETSVTQRWVRGELSNFQYLMNLNTIAGRSYNDLMQYPIFPWILADYTSEQLDLSKASTFRDLSRSVGAQTSDRLEQFKRRYAEWDDAETPPYHYGTFYSSAMIVASYMVRMEPFTQHFLRLQGGHFDLADRMFHSIHDSWVSASKHNMADVKELIPEFFYLPEFLKNENKYDLGIKQNGMKLGDVILPKWAKDDPREFIRIHRAALESEYVSAHLHEWIDLIFGYKQQGQPAVDAVNVFHHLFYEGNVDIYNTDIDPIKKNAVIGFINNFGQVPKQLFKKPHPVKRITTTSISNSGLVAEFKPLRPVLPGSQQAGLGVQQTQRALTRSPSHLKQSNLAMTFKDIKGPGGQIVQIDKNIVAVEQNKLLIPPEYCRYIAWGHPDRSLRLGLYGCEKSIFVWEGSDSLPASEVLCCTIPNNRTMITGNTESVITVWRIERMKYFYPLMNLHGHLEPVTCLASSQAYSLIVSGGRDRVAIVWDLNRLGFVRQLGSGPPPIHQGPISAMAINDSSGDIATCASSWLYLWSINGQLLAHIDSRIVVLQHSLASSQQQQQQSSAATLVSVGSGGPLHLVSVCFSKCSSSKQASAENDSGEVIITGANDGSVAMWSTQ